MSSLPVRSRRRRVALLLLAVLLGLGALLGWSLRPPAPGAPGTPPYVTFLLVDGLSQDVFRRELGAGRLPNIARLISEGTYVEDGISAFPSMTAYGYFPFLTARDSAVSGVLGLRWFDRTRTEGAFRHYVGRTYLELNRDFPAEPAWLYERYPGVHSFSVNSYANRGVHRTVMTGWSFSMAKYREHSGLVRALARLPGGESLFPDWAGAEAKVMDLAIEDLRHRPKLQWITFTSTDGRQHVWGTDDAYVALVRNVDTLIGRYREESARLGQEKDRIYVLVSDHGVADARRNLDLRGPLEAAGLRAWRGEATHLTRTQLDEPLEGFENVDVVLAVNGNMLNHVYLRDPRVPGAGGWRSRPPADLVDAYAPRPGQAPVNVIQRLRETEGVELVLTRPDARGVRVLGKRGQGFITGDGGGALAYRCEGEDPLHTGACDGVPRSAREWLARTHGGPFPDAIVRVDRLMRSAQVGELVVTSEPGVDLAADYEMVVGNYRGGHGGLRADQMRVPYVLAGPGVPQGHRVPFARAEDVGATVHALLGLTLPEGAEGQPLPFPADPERLSTGPTR